jgi:hypothetical protein
MAEFDLTEKLTHEKVDTLINELTYLNYKYNRNHAPDIKPDTWIAVYGQNTFAMERRYLKELIDG